MDQFDQAQELDAHFRQQAMTTHQRKAQQATRSSHNCEECGEEIPEERRLAAPGCTRCRDCQQEKEHDLR